MSAVSLASRTAVFVAYVDYGLNLFHVYTDLFSVRLRLNLHHMYTDMFDVD